jgi:hypothetical protein
MELRDGSVKRRVWSWKRFREKVIYSYEIVTIELELHYAKYIIHREGKDYQEQRDKGLLLICSHKSFLQTYNLIMRQGILQIY